MSRLAIRPSSEADADRPGAARAIHGVATEEVLGDQVDVPRCGGAEPRRQERRTAVWHTLEKTEDQRVRVVRGDERRVEAVVVMIQLVEDEPDEALDPGSDAGTGRQSPARA